MKLSSSLSENIAYLKETFPIGTSFDLITRNLYLGKTKAFWMGINGFCKTEVLQQIFSDLQNPLYMSDNIVENIEHFMNSKIGYAQAELTDDWDKIVRNLLSGPTALFVDGFSQAILLDVRNYPTRSIEEPDAERVIRGARDGFVETLLFNSNLIRRRIRCPKLTFEMMSVGVESKTDVALAYIGDQVNTALLNNIKETIAKLKVSSITMGSKSLEELLIKKRWCNPLPSIQSTGRPDVACSYLMEGHILILVDNSPDVLILPCTIFQFTQSPEDYYNNPSVGNYFRLIRFACVFISLFLMPVFLLVTAYMPELSERLQLHSSSPMGPIRLIFYVFAVEFLLDLFRYSSAHSPSGYSGSLSIIGGLIIGDVAVKLNWASPEVLFYAAVTLLTSLTLSSVAFSDAIRIYRIFLIAATSFFGVTGFVVGVILMLLSILTTPTFAGMSYFWPLFPFNWKALKTLLFRYPTAKSQPVNVWKR